MRIHAGTFVGSGFFIAPRTVVTCAHVVGSRSELTIEWHDQRFPARVLLTRPEEGRGAGEYWAFPDLAVLVLDDPATHPVAWLDDNPPVSGDVLDAYGFSQKTAQSGVQADGLQIVVAGQAGDYWRVKDDQVVGGLSGCLAVNNRTGLVAGVVKASRDQGNALGGWIIPSSQVRSLLPAEAMARRFDDEWLGALLAPLKPMFQAYQMTSQMLPYKLLDGPTPPLGQIYVRQQADDGQPVDVRAAITSRVHSVFVGPPGSGKSSLVQHICGETARWWLSPAGDPPYGLVVPVPLSAAALVGGGPLAEILAAKTAIRVGAYLDVELPVTVFAQAPAPGVQWLLLVDGLDEVLDAEKRTMLIQMLEHRIRSPDNAWRFVITTRPLFTEDLEKLTEAAAGSLQLLPFDQGRIEEFARGWFRVRDPEHAEERASEFLRQASSAPLTGVVSIPLLATIAAIVFESHPERGLPGDVRGLYSEFIRLLLVERRRQVAEEVLRGRLESFGSVGRELAAWLADSIEQVLARIAGRWFFDSQVPIAEIAQDVLSELHPSPVFDKPSWPQALSVYLTETGLLVASHDRLDWLHLSFAEYLAAHQLVTRSRPRKWMWLAGGATTANLVQFGLADELAQGRAPMRSLRRLAGGSRASAMLSNLISSGDLLNDAQIRVLLRHALWGVAMNRTYTSLQPDLHMYLSRSAGVRELRRVAASRRQLTFIRISAARTLLLSQDAAARLSAAQCLLSFAESRRFSPRDRIAAAAALASRSRGSEPRIGATGPDIAEQAAPEELAGIGDKALQMLPGLIQRRMLVGKRWYRNLETAQDFVPKPLQREVLRKILEAKSIGTEGKADAARMLIRLGDGQGVVWLAAAARRSLRGALIGLTLVLVAIGVALPVVPWPLDLSVILVAELATAIVALLFHLGSRWSRPLAQAQNRARAGNYLSAEEKSRVSEALAQRPVGLIDLVSYARVPVLARLVAGVRSVWLDNAPRVLLTPVTELYAAGRNDEADREFIQLQSRIGPVRMWRIAKYACEWARDNPRSARPLLTAILRQRPISPFRRRKIRRLLGVLGG